MLRLLIACTLLFIGSPAHALSLQEALKTALEQNPKPKSKDLQVLAMKDHVRAAWLGMLPSVTVGASQSFGKSDTRLLEDRIRADGKNEGAMWNINFNLFNGRIDYFSAKITENEMKAMEALFNSTNPLVENTKGALASVLMHTYVDIAFSESVIVELENALAALNIAIAASTDADDIGIYKTKAANLNIQISKFRNNIAAALMDYEYIVTQPPTSAFDTLDQVIASLEIPATADEAVEEAKKNSPDLKYRVYQLQAAEYATKIARARSIMPLRVDLTYSKGALRGYDRLTPTNNFRVQDERLELSASWSFDPGSFSRKSAALKQLRSARLEQEAALNDLRHNIRKTYQTLKASLETDESYRAKYQAARVKLDEVLRSIEAGQTVNREDMLLYIQDVADTGIEFAGTKQAIVMKKFGIQQTMGTLFSTTNQVRIQGQ